MQKDPYSNPDPRFENFQECFNAEKIAIGFSLPGSTHLFKYEQDGGWFDEKGNYFSKDGILEEEAPNSNDNDHDRYLDSDSDDQILDELQQMLADEEEGIVRKKPSEKPVQSSEKGQSSKPVESADQGQVDYDKKIHQLVEEYKKNQGIRDGLPKELFLFFKMKKDLYEKVKLEVQQQTSVKNQNAKVKQLQTGIQKVKEVLIAKNKDWISGDHVRLDFSGSSKEEGKYERYWYGTVKTTPEKFEETWSQIAKSKEFTLLKHKTFYAIKSKLYLKDKIKQEIKNHQQTVKKIKKQQIIEISLNNLPEQFPVSFVFDLFELCGAKQEDIIEIKIKNDFTAIVKATACAALNISKQIIVLICSLEGYCHEKGEYVWIDIKSSKKELIEKKGWFKIGLDSPYKINFAELHDTMAFEQARTEVLKTYQKGEQYRWLLHQNILKRTVMFRGPTVNIGVIRQQCTEKDVEQNIEQS